MTMTTEKIRQELEKLKTLSELNERLKGNDDILSHKKIGITREEMLRCTYNVGKLLKEIEEKV